MPRVRGSRQEKMIVVPYRPYRAIILRFGFLLLMLGLAAASFIAGRDYGDNANAELRAERDRLLVSYQEASEQVNALERLRLNLEQSSTLDRRALEEVQSSLVGLRESNARMEEELSFYRQAMAMGDDERGLIISQLDLKEMDEENKVSYRLELRQLGNESPVSGFANINILGKRNQEDVSLPLHSLSDSLEEPEIPLQFRYFQNIEGELLLPEDFEPESVQVIAVNQGAGGATVERSFNWAPEMLELAEMAD